MYGIGSSIRQAIFSRPFLTGVLGMAAIVFLSSVEAITSAFRSETLLAYGFARLFIVNALQTDAMAMALPILCALPYTSAFVDDVKNGFVKAYLPRTTLSKYILGKLFGCMLSGGLVLLCGVALSSALAMLLFSPITSRYRPVDPSEFAVFWRALPLFFASGAFWSLVGLVAASATMSRYMAYASPFIVYYVLIILVERYFPKLYVLYPKAWLFPSENWMFGAFGVVLLLAEYAALLCFAFHFTARRRLEYA